MANYIIPHPNAEGYILDSFQLERDIPHVVRAMDNVIDSMHYPLEDQEEDAKNKRRMGLGVMGVANAIETLGYPYGSPLFLKSLEINLKTIRDGAYQASVNLAKERGAFPLFEAEKYLESKFVKTLPVELQGGIRKYGIRNSHLLSIAPTGTISFCANYVSTGIEPVLHYECDRTVQTFDGPTQVRVKDYGYSRYKTKGKLAADVTFDEHLAVQEVAQKFVDSAVSKTVNFWPSKNGEHFYEKDFHAIYTRAWKSGLKGITVHNYEGKRAGLFKEVKEESDVMCSLEGKECG